MNRVPISQEKTLELLSDIDRAMSSLLVHEFGIPKRAFSVNIQTAPIGLTLQVDSTALPVAFRRTPNAVTEIMTQLCTSLRAVLDRATPSLSSALGMRYLPDRMRVEIGVGPDADPIYPHIVVGTVRELRATKHLRRLRGLPD